MELLLKDVLNLTPDEIKNGKIELNTTAGTGAEYFVDRWLRCDMAEKESGITNCSYWGWAASNKRNFYPGQPVFSFIQIGYDEWLFISAAVIKSVPENSRAEVEPIEKYKPFFGRVIVNHKRNSSYGGYVFKIENRLPAIVVKEILPCMYSGEKFEGYDRVHLPYARLKDVFAGRILPTYYEALKKVTGVYCLTDTSNGKLYIGSATGTEGVAQRWGNYLSSKHGGNVKLRRLYDEKGDEYFEQYFTYTLLEYFGLSYDPEKVKNREQYWKKCFDTIKNGYNDH